MKASPFSHELKPVKATKTIDSLDPLRGHQSPRPSPRHRREARSWAWEHDRKPLLGEVDDSLANTFRSQGSLSNHRDRGMGGIA